MARTGVSDPDEAQALYALLMELPGLFVRGLHAYDGQVKAHDPSARTAEADAAFARLEVTTNELKRAGFPVEERIIGGSPSFAIHAQRAGVELGPGTSVDRKSTRLNSSHTVISYAVFCLKKKKIQTTPSLHIH